MRGCQYVTYTLDIRTVRSLAVYLNTGDRFARPHDFLHDLLNLVGNLRNGFAHRSSDMIGDRDAANFRQMLIDHQVTAIGT